MSKYEGRDRYQFQPWYVKSYRWVRFILPALTIRAPWCILLWVLKGARKETIYNSDTGELCVIMGRRETVYMIWTCKKSWAQVKAGHYFTSEEVFGRLQH